MSRRKLCPETRLCYNCRGPLKPKLIRSRFHSSDEYDLGCPPCDAMYAEIRAEKEQKWIRRVAELNKPCVESQPVSVELIAIEVNSVIIKLLPKEVCGIVLSCIISEIPEAIKAKITADTKQADADIIWELQYQSEIRKKKEEMKIWTDGRHTANAVNKGSKRIPRRKRK